MTLLQKGLLEAALRPRAVTDHAVTDHAVTDHGVTDHGVTDHGGDSGQRVGAKMSLDAVPRIEVSSFRVCFDFGSDRESEN